MPFMRADIGTIRYQDGSTYRLAADYGCSPEWHDHLARQSPKPDRGSIFGRTIVEGGTIHIPDVLADPEFTRLEAQKLMGIRAALGVPLIREGQVFGVLSLICSAPRSFTEKQIELVETFADQAVIAIENVGLFEEVQAKTRDLTEALVYQTGSSNILKVIASSPTDVAPVLKAIVESACELCEAYDAAVFLNDGGDLLPSAHHGPILLTPEKSPIDRNWTAGRAFLDRKPVHVHDFLSAEGDDFPVGQERARRFGFRSVLSVPLSRDGESIGTVALRRTEVHPFSDKQIKLLQTFADQAVIAIDNVRCSRRCRNGLILLRHNFRCLLRLEIGLMQQGHRDNVDTRAAFNLLRTVAIEFGTCRSGRNGGSPRSISFGNCNFLEELGGGCF